MLNKNKINIRAREIFDKIDYQMKNLLDTTAIRQAILAGKIQGHKSWTAIAIIAHAYREFKGKVSCSYVTTESIKEEKHIRRKLIDWGIPENKIFILKSDSSQVSRAGTHLKNIEDGCVHIWINNHARMDGKNFNHYKVALTKFVDCSKSRYHIAFTDDLHTSVKDKKDLENVPDEQVLQFKKQLPIRDVLISDFRKMPRTFLLDISGTNASQLGREDGKYKFYESWRPDNYTQDVQHISTSVLKSH